MLARILSHGFSRLVRAWLRGWTLWVCTLRGHIAHVSPCAYCPAPTRWMCVRCFLRVELPEADVLHDTGCPQRALVVQGSEHRKDV